MVIEHLLKPIADVSDLVLEKLNALNLYSYWDILLHIPLRYEDLTEVSSIEASTIGSKSLVEGEVVSCEVIQKKKRQLRVILSDKTAYITLIFLHFYPNYLQQFQVGRRIQAYGEIKGGMLNDKTIFHPKIKSVTEALSLPKTFSPIYATTDGFKQYQIIKVINLAIDYLEQLENKYDKLEIIPESVLKQNKLNNISDAIKLLHRLTPEQFAKQEQKNALARLKFDEFLVQQLLLLNIYRNKHKEASEILKPRATYTKELFSLLPFQLTGAQQKSLGEIYADIAKPTQMNRLLQGDVGSGKTIVAAFSMLVAVENSFQAAIIAPTEILAEQHYLKISELLKPLKLNIIWLSGSMRAKDKREAYAKIESGVANFIIGTHAVFQKDVMFHKLALVVIDEQHRFGVEQRLKLQSKGNNPHQLMMSATPIPRSLAMSYYADLDISVIDELPPGRTPIETLLVGNNRKHEVLEFIRNNLAKNAQVYWVCPLIEESEKLDLESALNAYEELKLLLPEITIGLIHGKLKAGEKALIMDEFKQGKLQILVATTVIEVGVDVPNASIMVIEHSERIGLASLHQLRGRVGRGMKVSTCILLYQTPLTEIAKKRLKTIKENNDGFKIAHEDLLIRGPGEILGSRQSGLPVLKFANLETDMPILLQAKTAAKTMLRDYSKEAKLLVKLWFNRDEEFLKV